jgi:hypothetical protein
LVGAKGLIKSAFNEAAKIQAKRAALRAALKMKGTESVAAGFGKLTAKDKIAIYLANGTVNLAELALTLGKYNMAIDFATEGIWDKIYEQYKNLSSEEKNVYFGGRLAEYKYYDMDKVISSALNFVEQF